MFEDLMRILMRWSLQNEEYYMAYVLFTEFNTEIPVKLLYGLKTRKVVTMDTEGRPEASIHDDSKVITDKALLDLMESVKRSKYGQLRGGGFGYTTF